MIVDDKNAAARTTNGLDQHMDDFNMDRLRAPSATEHDSMKLSSSGG